MATPAPAVPSPRPLDTFAILGETFSIYFSNFLAFFLITLIVFVPVFALPALRPELGQDFSLNLQWSLLERGIGLICQAIATAALTYGVLLHLRRRPGSVADCLGGGLTVVLPVLGVSIVQALLTALGLMLCIVPGLMAIAAFGVSVPAAVEERPGVFGALFRSVALTAGNRWQIFFVFFALGLLTFAVGVGLAIAVAGPQLAAGRNPGPMSAGFETLTNLVSVVPVGLSATASAVLYYRLRSSKESIDVADLVSVFD